MWFHILFSTILFKWNIKFTTGLKCKQIVFCALFFLKYYRNPAAIGHGCFCYALLRSIPVAVYIILITGLRYHLFIWSVFSPKLLYEGIHTFITAAVCAFFTVVDHQRRRDWNHWPGRILPYLISNQGLRFYSGMNILAARLPMNSRN